MKLRYLLAIAVGCILLLGVSSADALTRIPTKLTLDSSVAVGNGYWLDSGRVFTQTLNCEIRPVVLVGIRSDGTKRVLDFSFPSGSGLAWATNSKRIGLKRVVAKMYTRRGGRPGHRYICKSASIEVFPTPALMP